MAYLQSPFLPCAQALRIFTGSERGSRPPDGDGLTARISLENRPRRRTRPRARRLVLSQKTEDENEDEHEEFLSNVGSCEKN